MANRWRQYSYTAQKDYLRRVRIVLAWVFVCFVIHTIISAFFVSNRVVENNTMRPGLEAGDRFVFASFTFQHLFRDRASGNLPFRRGQIALVDRGGRRPLARTALDTVARFFTFQRLSLFPREDTLFIKRVVALPGDTVSMDNYVVRIKPADETYEYTEFELSGEDYTPALPRVSLLWDESVPFSGSMETITLKEEECFVLSDDRSVTNDSRTWGPVPASSILGRALVRYWPPNRIGRP
ncbi:MAG: signal peptidase I [Treponema sp.]|jgi:signal peptidase I|nr:signal peptidase I [Treponema sp.]